MRRSDYFFLSVVAIIIVGTLVVLLRDLENSYSGRNQKTVDVTDSYLIPDGLEDCRIFRLTPAGFGQTLYVISRDGDPKMVGWPGYKGRMTFVMEKMP
jgi:hypothetical protein